MESSNLLYYVFYSDSVVIVSGKGCDTGGPGGDGRVTGQGKLYVPLDGSYWSPSSERPSVQEEGGRSV